MDQDHYNPVPFRNFSDFSHSTPIFNYNTRLEIFTYVFLGQMDNLENLDKANATFY